jgi:zinc protease
MKPVYLSLPVFFFTAALALGQTPATQPAAATQPTTEMLQSKSAMAGYGAEAYRLVDQKDEIVSVLRNGLTVIVKRVPTPVVAVRGLVGTGGVYEGKWLGGGLSHLLEHLVAGGSSERRTEAQNKELLQKIGNNSNAYTTEDRTAFFVNTTTPHMEQAVDLVTGWLLGAKITVPEYHREYQVVQRELEMGKGEPDRQFFYMSAMNRYRVSPARVPVIGYQAVIQGLSRDDVYNYYKMAYQPDNIVFAVVGDYDPEVMLATVRKYVSDAKPGRVFSHDLPAEPPVLAPRTLVATFPKLGQARLELGFPSVKLDNPDLYALDLLSTILGNGNSSILVEELRDKRQLVSTVAASDYTPTYVDGTFAVYMRLDPDKVDVATQATLDLLEQLKTQPIDEARIRRAKTQLKVARVKSLQTAEDISTSLADDYMSTGDLHFDDRYVERIEKVTPAQLQDVARRYLDKTKLLTTLMVPSEAPGAAGLAKAEDMIRPVAPATQAVATTAASAVQRVELDNGVTLLLKRITTSPLVVMNMYSLGGVTAEDDATNGLGNLTMQMLQRGTTTRNAEQIATFFDSVGGELQCACGNNTWYWNASCLKADFEKTLEAYADVVNHPTFPDAEAGPMKQRIEAAIASQDANWIAQAFRYFKSIYFGPSQSPYRFMAIGTQKNVESFTPEQMRKWYSQKVLASRRVLAIYGDINMDQAKSLAEKYLGGGANPQAKTTPGEKTGEKTGGGAARLPTATAESRAALPPVPSSNLPGVNVTEVKVQKTQQALAGIVIGYKSDSIIGNPTNYILDVDQTLAGGWQYPTGYLFETLRGKGLVYVVQAQNSPGRSAATPGNFIVFAGCDPSKVNEVVDQILLNIARLQGTPADIQADWFHRSKLLITVADAMESETPQQQAITAALDELFGLGYDYHDQFAGRINAVTLDQVRQAAAARLRQCVVTICTPNPQDVNIKTGPRSYGSFPPVDLTPKGVQHDTGAPK